MSSSSHREVFCKKGLKNSQNSQENTCIRVTFDRVLARSYLMTLCFIFPILVNFPITSSCVLKAPIHRKKVNCVTLLEKAFFFLTLLWYYTSCCIWLLFPFDHDMCLFSMFLYLSFINYFRHVTFFTCGSFSIFVKKGCEKKEKISRKKYNVDTLADTSTIRSSHRGCSVRKGVLRNLQNSQENTCARVSFLIKLQDWYLQLYLKRDSGLGVFLWNLRNF